MSNRSHILSVAAAIVLSGSAWAQTQPPEQNNPPNGPPTGAPQSTVPNNPNASPSAVSQDQQVDPYSTDKDFVKSVAESSATEVQLGKLAQTKASNDAVKDLGKKMVEAHTQNGEQMKQAAAALKIQVPEEPPRKSKKAEEKLAKLSGSDFDHAYAKMAADEQKQAVKQFEREAKNGKVPGVKDFAAKKLPEEQDRQKQAEELASTAGSKAQK